MVLLRVGEPLLRTVVTNSVGKLLVRVFVGGFVVLIVLHSVGLVTGGTAIVTFAMCALVLGVIVPGIVSGTTRTPRWREEPQGPEDGGHTEDSGPDDAG